MFGRGKATASRAREALYDPVFAAPKLGPAALLHVEYDPALWLRVPRADHDRTAWRRQAIAAVCTDYAWGAQSTQAQQLGAILDEVCRSDLRHAADFVALPRELGNRAVVAFVDALDGESMRLEHGAVETWQTFTDVLPERPSKPASFPQGWTYATARDSHAGTTMLRAHKVPHEGAHLIGTGFFQRGKDIGPCLSLFVRARL